MEQNTFVKKTVVLAALSAISLMAVNAYAAEGKDGGEGDKETVNIEVKVGGEGNKGVSSDISNEQKSVVWGSEWLKKEGVLGENEEFGGLTIIAGKQKTITISESGSMTIDLPTVDEERKYVTFDGVGVTVEEDADFENESYTIFQNGADLVVKNADFTNASGGVLKFDGSNQEDNASLTIDYSNPGDVDDFVNNGKIMIENGATMNVGDETRGVMKVSKDTDFALNIGDVEVGKDSVLTNYDKGYQYVKDLEDNTGDTETQEPSQKADEGNAEGGEENDESEIKTLVHFGTVTVSVGGKFVNAKDARSSGETLILQNSGKAEIDGTSEWGSLVLSGVEKSGDETSKSISDFVTISEGGEFAVTDSLTIKDFEDGAKFAINGADQDKDILADGVDLTFGAHVSKDAFTQTADGNGLEWDEDKQFFVGEVTLSDFSATWTTDSEEITTPGEGDDEGSSAEDGKDDGEEPTGSWSYKKFGDVTAINTKLTISGNRTNYSEENSGKYTPSLQMSSLNVVGTAMKIAYDVDVDKIKKAVQDAWNNEESPIDMGDWTKDNILEKLDALFKDETYAGLKETLDEARGNFEEKLAGILATATGTKLDTKVEISCSDLAIGTLTLARNEVKDSSTIKIEKPFADAGTGTTAEEDGEEPEKETVTITGDKEYNLGDLTLEISDSRLDVGTLDLQTGTITVSESAESGTDNVMMIGKVESLNGALTFEQGYLGLNTSKTVADIVDQKAEQSIVPNGFNATVEIGSAVTIGENGKLTFGGEEFEYQGSLTTSEGDETPKNTDYTIGFAGNTELKFDARNFNSKALFSQNRTEGKGIVTVSGGTALNIKGENLSWGVYKLFDEDTLDTSDLSEVTIRTEGSTASDVWKEQVEKNGIKVDPSDKNQIIVGGTTIEGSGLTVDAVNLVNSVVGGDRGSSLDKQLINAILSNGNSVEEMSNTINAVTGMGAVAGLTAMTVDFGTYVTDQVEHHATTIPHEQEGWWVQPIAGRLKSDDLAVGSMKGGYSIDTFGIMGGFDRKLRNGDIIGLAASWQSGDADSEGDAVPVSTDVTNYGLHLWHARKYNDFRVMGMLSYSKTSGDAEMNVLGNTLKSDLGATSIAIGARADMEKNWGKFRMMPHIGARATMVDVDDYSTELGANELFKVSEDKLWIFEVPVGVTFSTAFEYARWNVQPYVDLTVRGRFGDTDSTYTVTGSNTSDKVTYDVTGDVIGDLRLGYMSTFKDLNLGMSYGLSAGDGGRQNHQFEATLRIDFD